MNSPTGSPVSVLAIEQPALPLLRSSTRKTNPAETRILDLLTSRLCHEMSGPIAAINNGIELLAEEDPDFQRDALALVGDSARRASLQLQFYRFAYGYSHGGATVGAAPQDLANLFFAATRIACNYGETVRILPLASQKLACNLLLVGAEALPRGGGLTINHGPHGLDLQAVGDGVFLSSEIDAALLRETPVAALTSRSVQAYFTAILADTLGCRLVHRTEPRRFQLTAITLPG